MSPLLMLAHSKFVVKWMEFLRLVAHLIFLVFTFKRNTVILRKSK